MRPRSDQNVDLLMGAVTFVDKPDCVWCSDNVNCEGLTSSSRGVDTLSLIFFFDRCIKRGSSVTFLFFSLSLYLFLSLSFIFHDTLLKN